MFEGMHVDDILSTVLPSGVSFDTLIPVPSAFAQNGDDAWSLARELLRACTADFVMAERGMLSERPPELHWAVLASVFLSHGLRNEDVEPPSMVSSTYHPTEVGSPSRHSPYERADNSYQLTLFGTPPRRSYQPTVVSPVQQQWTPITNAAAVYVHEAASRYGVGQASSGRPAATVVSRSQVLALPWASGNLRKVFEAVAAQHRQP
jgi:hypothetical protein